MKLCFISMTICLALLATSVVYGETEPTLTLNGQELRLTTPQEMPTLMEVLSVYGVEGDGLDAMGRFLENALPIDLWYADSVDVWDVFVEPIDLDDGSQLEIVHVVGTIGEYETYVEMAVSDGILLLTVTRYTEIGTVEADFEYEILEFDVSSSTHSGDECGDDALPPGQPIVLYAVAALVCRCDTAGGGSCNTTMCDDIKTCPLKNGTSCAWESGVAYIVPVPTSLTVEERDPVSAGMEQGRTTPTRPFTGSSR